MTKAQTEAMNQAVAEIARLNMRIATLEERKNDSLDFHERGVVTIREALQAAYEAGFNATRGNSK